MFDAWFWLPATGLRSSFIFENCLMATMNFQNDQKPRYDEWSCFQMTSEFGTHQSWPLTIWGPGKYRFWSLQVGHHILKVLPANLFMFIDSTCFVFNAHGSGTNHHILEDQWLMSTAVLKIVSVPARMSSALNGSVRCVSLYLTDLARWRASLFVPSLLGMIILNMYI